MALPIVRHFAFYWRNKKAATVNDLTVKFMPARTPVFGAEGLLCHAVGAKMWDVEISEVIPVSGSTTLDDIEKFIYQDATVKIGAQMGGKFFRSEMVVTGVEYKSNSETGKAEGKITLQGPIPDMDG